MSIGALDVNLTMMTQYVGGAQLLCLVPSRGDGSGPEDDRSWSEPWSWKWFEGDRLNLGGSPESW